MHNEQWKKIEKAGILFNVSNKGNVQVLGSKKGKFIKTFKEADAFSLIGGHLDSRYLSTHGQYVHRLVAEVWIGPIPTGFEVNHKNSNKHDNEASNLEIVTSSQNVIHAFENGLHASHTLSRKELERREFNKEISKMNNMWVVLNLDLKPISQFLSQEDAAASIGVSRMSANNSFRLAKPILKKYYICRRSQIEELQQLVSVGVAL